MKPIVVGLLYSILIVQLCYTTAKDVVCGFPGAPASGYVKPDLKAYEEGDAVSYSCLVGYILLGSPRSRCTKDGSWSEEVPICDDSMTTLGVAFSTATVPGHVAEMAIDKDKETCTYLKPEKHNRWWRIDLGKEYKVLTVAVTMISPDKYVKFTIHVVKNERGDASYKKCAYFSGKFGTQTVVMSCKDNGIVGEKVHIEDHLKTEGLFELCEVEVQVEKENPGYDCGSPSRNLNSIIIAPQPVFHAPIGARVDYGCIPGYELEGDEYRTCLDSGQWSDEPPECEPIICDELETIDNGHAILSHENGQPLEGAIVYYKCDEGYKLIGSFDRTCLGDGSWSGKTPQCKAIKCPITSIPSISEVGGIYSLVNQSNSMGSMALLQCRRAKREGDNPYIICTEDGTWTPPQAHCILPAGAAYERKEESRIANQGAIIFGMIVAAVMIVVVLVALYLFTQKRRDANKPELPSRAAEPPVPPPRPPPRKGGAIKSAIMGLISRDSDKYEDQRELQNSWQGDRNPDDPAVIEVEVLPHGENKRKVYPVPEENENTSLENVVLDVDEKGSVKDTSQKEQSDYASVDYNKKRQSRLLKEQDSIDSSSTAAASPLPSDDVDKKLSRSPTPPKEVSASEEESSEEASSEAEDESEKRKEEEKKAKEEAERKAKEEEERKAKEEAEKKAKEAESAAGQRRRRLREEPPAPVEEDKPALRRFRRFQ